MDSGSKYPDGTKLEPGTVLRGGYRLDAVLAAGGMSCVYTATELAVKRTVAVKVAGPGKAFRDALGREAEALAAVSHPGVPILYALRHEEDLVYMAMERIVGVTLREALETRGAHASSFSVLEVAETLIALADVLAAVHNGGIVHRDIKPENVVTGAGNRVVLLDLGVFRPESGGTTEVVAGTPGYLAPEERSGDGPRELGHRGDLYSLGVLGFELLTGARPFEPAGLASELARQLVEEIPDVRRVRGDVPPGLAALLCEMTRIDPWDRPVDAAEVRERLVPVIRTQREQVGRPTQRSARRFPERLNVLYGVEKPVHYAETANVSASGLALHGPYPAATGKELVLKFNIPGGPVTLHGVVKWNRALRESRRTAMGIAIPTQPGCEPYAEYVAALQQNYPRT